MTDDINKLIEKGHRSLNLAREIYRRGDYDFAVSRAYYAMFYLTQALLLTKDLSFSSHSAVIAAFGQHFVKTGLLTAKLHEWLREAFDKRAVGDYSYEITITQAEAERILDQAEEFIKSVEKYLSEQG
ncbi:MAG: HEPN domain-containing protein [Candidatus Brocadiales bacterium]|nr:HEPN domain-containing protein [Candidatus Brocadiales bacterium]